MSTSQSTLSFGYTHRTTRNAAAIRLAENQRAALLESGELREWFARDSTLISLVRAGTMSCWCAYRIANNL